MLSFNEAVTDLDCVELISPNAPVQDFLATGYCVKEPTTVGSLYDWQREGPAFIALRQEVRDDVEARLAKLKQERPVFSWLRNRDARWVKPVIT